MHIISEAPITRRRMLAAAITAIAAAATPTAAPARATAQSYAVSLGQQVIRLTSSGISDAALKKRFVSLFTRTANIDSVARFALGKYARRLPRQMWPTYRRLVLIYITNLLVWYRQELAAQKIVARGRIARRGRWMTVPTQLVFSNGATSTVKWRVLDAGGRYHVGDVNIKGIWLSLRMRDKFVAILNKSGGDFAPLLAYLRESETWKRN
ncbi:MAG TPA: hypothetical protein ENK15_08670 [Thermopetrobacter sp.]|nr:hypothetical protein [Thermopetrobacter sp.]